MLVQISCTGCHFFFLFFFFFTINDPLEFVFAFCIYLGLSSNVFGVFSRLDDKVTRQCGIPVTIRRAILFSVMFSITLIITLYKSLKQITGIMIILARMGGNTYL